MTFLRHLTNTPHLRNEARVCQKKSPCSNDFRYTASFVFQAVWYIFEKQRENLTLNQKLRQNHPWGEWSWYSTLWGKVLEWIQTLKFLEGSKTKTRVKTVWGKIGTMLLCRNSKKIFKKQNKQGYSTPTLSNALYLNSVECHITIIHLIKINFYDSLRTYEIFLIQGT